MWREALAAGIFTATVLLLALGRWGRLDIPRGAAALGGGLATALLLGGWSAVDLDVIALLAGLMALCGLAAAAGLFRPLDRLARMPPALALFLALLVVAATSAVLLNDAAVVVLVPMLLPVLGRLPPVPTVTMIAVAANIGSLATPFGNPQNAALAAASGHGVVDFLAAQWPLLAAGAVALALASMQVARHARPASPPPPSALTVNPPGRAALERTVIPAACVGLFVGAAVVGVPLGVAAVAAACIAYVALRGTLGATADQALRVVDLNILALFVGLYLLTAGLPAWAPRLDVTDTWRTAGAVVVAANVFGNVPTVLSLLELDPAWSVAHTSLLVAVSTLGGAMLLTGSAASLIAADTARRAGVRVGFWAFAKQAVPWTAPLLLLALWWHG